MAKPQAAKPPRTGPAPAAKVEEFRPARDRVAWLLMAILVLAAGIRLSYLDGAPPGVYPDEAINGVQGWEAAQTHQFKLFYPENNGREGLLINLIGLTEKLLGPSPFSLRFWPAMFGTLTVLGMFILARHLFKSDSVALVSACFLAASFWHINFSRIAFAGIQAPFFLTWGIGLFLAAQTMRRGYFLAGAGGALFGLGFHSYAAYRFAPLVAILCFLAVLPKAKPQRRKFVAMIAVWVLCAAGAAAPLGIHFIHHPADFFGRASQVSIWRSTDPWNTFLNGCVDTLLMFNFRGDRNSRHNIPGSPQLLLPVGIAFWVGIWIAAKSSAGEKVLGRKVLNPFSLPLWWVLIMLLPEELSSEGIPHALRSIGAVPAVMMLSALGFDRLCRRFNADPFRGLPLAILTLTAAAEVYRYFGIWATDPATARAFNQDYVAIGREFTALPPGVPRFLVVEARGALVPHRNPDGEIKEIPMPAQTVIFETLGHPPVTYLLPGDAQTYMFPPGAKVATIR